MSVRTRHPGMSADATAIRYEQARRFSAWARQQWPMHTAKMAARVFGVSPVTIEKVLSGERPLSGELRAKGEAFWKWQFVQAIAEIACGPVPTPAMTHEEIRQARASLDAMRERLEKLEAGL